VTRPALLLVLLVCFVAACGASAREKVLHGSYIAVTSAQSGFEAWDRVHQDDIVDKATSYEDGVAKLEAYWKAQVAVTNAFEAAYRAIAAAALADTEPLTMKTVRRTYDELVLALQKLTGGKLP
jgi:hypothetical protein